MSAPITAFTVAMAIKAAWDANTTLVALTGPIFTEEVPEKIALEDLALPYSWLDVGKSEFVWTFEKCYIECTDVTFHVINTGLNTVELAAAKFRNDFDWVNLDFSSLPASRCLSSYPTNYQLVPEMARYKDGKPIFRAIISYHLLVERFLS